MEYPAHATMKRYFEKNEVGKMYPVSLESMGILTAEFQSLLRKCGEYEDALEYYADDGVYVSNVESTGFASVPVIYKDNGTIAKTVLSNNKQPEGKDE